MNSAVLHAIIVIVGIIAYTALTIAGYDGNTVLTATLGYAGGAGVEKAVTK